MELKSEITKQLAETGFISGTYNMFPSQKMVLSVPSGDIGSRVFHDVHGIHSKQDIEIYPTVKTLKF